MADLVFLDSESEYMRVPSLLLIVVFLHCLPQGIQHLISSSCKAPSVSSVVLNSLNSCSNLREYGEKLGNKQGSVSWLLKLTSCEHYIVDAVFDVVLAVLLGVVAATKLIRF